MTQRPDFEPKTGEPVEESADLFDYALLRDLAVYMLGSIGRHKLVVLAAPTICILVALGLLRALPKNYFVDARLLAQRNQVIASLGNPNRTVPYEADAPTRAAAETILRHDNLIALAQQTNLVVEWQRKRAPILHLKDWILHLLGKDPTREEQLAALVFLLEQRLHVTTGEGTVTISIDWPDAQSAYQLVDAAEQSFLEARHVSESSAISEAISLLEGHAALLRDRVTQSAEQLKKEAKIGVRVVSRPKLPVGSRPAPVERATPADDPEVTRLSVMLAAKLRSIKDLEEFRGRRLAELQAKMTEQRTIYSPAHPVIIDLQERIDALEKQESTQIGGLRQDAQELAAELARRGRGKPSQLAEAPPSARPLPGEFQRLEREVAKNEDPALENLRGELRFALSKHAQLVDRIDAARMELDAARAAFKYRYSVIRPPEVPRAPTKPNAPLTLAMALVAGLGLGVLLAVFIDWKRGQIVEPWQVERRLGLPVLVELKAAKGWPGAPGA